MFTYLGPLGGLVPLHGVNSVSIPSRRESTEKVTLGGRRKVQRAPVSRREWAVSTHARLTPAEAAGLLALELGSTPPWVWVDPYAQVTNVFSPEQSVLLPGTWFGEGFVPGGRIVAADGAMAPSSVARASGGTITFGYRDGVEDFPAAVAGADVSGSVYVRGTGSLSAQFLDYSGAMLSEHLAAYSNATVSRVGVTAIAPEETASVRLSVSGAMQVAMPAVTWTPALVEWAVGHGCNRVTVSELSESVTQAMVNGPRRSGLSFTVREVG